MFKGYPGFILIRYGKTHRHGNGYHGGRILLYSQIPKKKRHGMPCGDTWGISRGLLREQGSTWTEPLLWFPWEGMGKTT